MGILPRRHGLDARVQTPVVADDRGAALIVAIGVLTLLLVIAVTFFRVSREEIRTANNSADNVRAELLADGATAVAIAFLNQDLLEHPSYTSLDHAWRSYFNGSWAVGKPWMWAPLDDPTVDPANMLRIHPMSLLRKGIPEFDPARTPIDPSVLYIPRVDVTLANTTLFNQVTLAFDTTAVDLSDYTTRFGNGAINMPFATTTDLASRFADPLDPTNVSQFPPIEAMFVSLLKGAGVPSFVFAEDLSVLEDRVFDSSDALAPDGRDISLLANPTALGVNNETLPYEQVHFWTDVDNDGDGLNDSMWLPVGADRLFPEDGLDNDLDGLIDGADPDGEPGVFLYRGNVDGLDNDNNGFFDEDDEARFVIFTVPTPFIDEFDNPVFLSTQERIDAGISGSDILLFEGSNTALGVNVAGRNVFSHDNDLDLVVDDTDDAAHFMLTQAAIDALLANDTTYPYFGLLSQLVNVDVGNNFVSLTGSISGETVSELVGRMAIHIKDEAGKVNLNTAGGHSYITQKTIGDVDESDEPLVRAFSEGVGPAEYDLRAVMGIGGATSNRIWNYRMGANITNPGAPNTALGPGDGLSTGAASPTTMMIVDPLTAFADFEAFANDISLPGYGFVDDNGNALQLSFNGIDDDGDASFYANDGIDNDGDGDVDEADEFLVGVDEGTFLADYDGDGNVDDVASLEGIDEPGEYQPFRPYRNIFAEGDSTADGLDGNFDGVIDEPRDNDNDGDGIFDEIGELGDNFYRTHEQIKLIESFGSNPDFGFEEMRRNITVHSSDRNERFLHRADDTTGVDGDGLALDPLAVGNASLRKTIGLRKDLNLTRPADIADALTRGWNYPASSIERRGDAPDGALANVNGVITPIVAGDIIAPQNAFTVAAFLSGLRQENVSVSSLTSMAAINTATFGGDAITLLADPFLRAHQIAATAKDYADIDNSQSVIDDIFVDDFWWRAIAANSGASQSLRDIAASQRIYYTTAGIEAIRINEVMVRPVRRFEAEAITLLSDTAYTIGLDPNRFVGAGLDEVAREDEGFRLQTRTSLDEIATLIASPPAGRTFTLLSQDIAVDAAQEASFGWQRRSDVPIPGGAVNPLLLGIDNAWATYRSYFRMREFDASSNLAHTFDVPDVVQFSFQATDELPAGRYYLIVNTQTFDDTGVLQTTTVNPSDLEFIFRTRELYDDIFANEINVLNLANSGPIDWSQWDAPRVLGSNALGGSEGMAFLQGDGALGFTVEVPAASTGTWLHVGIRSRKPIGDVLAVNFFDFSQEPDHEWVEVVNLDEDSEIDLSGWQLMVENHPLGFQPMTVPQGTVIAPGGMLLLGTNKYDYGFATTAQATQLYNGNQGFRTTAFHSNGIGLVNGRLLNGISANAVKPFDAVTAPVTFGTPANGAPSTVFTGIVEVDQRIDFVDNDGDGVLDAPADRLADDRVVSTRSDAPQILIPGFPLGTNATGGDKPWDRIVELEIPDLVPQLAGPSPNPLFPTPLPLQDFDAGQVGRIVLAGGIFPNRPEFDLVDNDGDNPVLARDLIDNDGDGFIDEFDEGFDEGRFARDARLSDFATPVPGSFHAQTVRYLSDFFDFDPATSSQLAFLDKNVNPPRWVDFVERRNFPGDNVIVTLFEGPARGEQVADRVTYTQRDIDNRAIDDIVLVTDTDLALDGAGELTTADSPFPNNSRFLSQWPENTMGIDFYRSLERKHPYYTGDRFGTRNRFQATDGAYDDWADATSRWERNFGVIPNFGILDRLNAGATVYTTFAHALRGTPLRKNVSTRAIDIEVDDLDPRNNLFELADFRNRALVSPGDLLRMPHTARRDRFETVTDAANNQYILDRSSPNISFSADRRDLTYDKVLLGQRFDDVSSPINVFQDLRALVGDIGTTDSVTLTVAQARMIQVQAGGEPNVDTAWNTVFFSAPSNWAPVVLRRTLDEPIDPINPPATAFNVVFPASFPQTPPIGPLYEVRYLLENLDVLDVNTPTAGVDRLRWPPSRRTTSYVSSNRNFFSSDVEFPGPGNGAEALFVWDGDDGLENGEYDLFLVVNEPLTALEAAQRTFQFYSGGGSLLDGNFGVPFVNAAQFTNNNEVIVDVEVFTDRDGDRRVWNTEPTVETLNDVTLLNSDFESYGEAAGLQPDADGVIHYGTVRVENNVLAVLLRNRSFPGRIVRFSRAVLSARNKTPGRINVNTVETRRIEHETNPADVSLPDNFFNPLEGLPGLLARIPETDGVGQTTRLVDPANQTLFTDPSINGDLFAQEFARNIVRGKLRIQNEAPDGRYYELTADMLDDDHLLNEAAQTSPSSVRPPLVATDENALNVADLLNGNLNREPALNEQAYRFSKMQNLLTTRSDTFEILVTVQTGYGIDANGDGRVNWRDDDEFVVTAEQTARTIYER